MILNIGAVRMGMSNLAIKEVYYINRLIEEERGDTPTIEDSNNK